MLISDLRTMHLTNPVGYQMKQPTFSWLTHAPFRQFQIQISENSQFDKLVYESDAVAELQQHAFAADFLPRAKSRYYWRIIAAQENGDGYISPTAFFESGKADDPWQASWITAPFSQTVHPYFQKNFEVRSAVRQARAYVTALGVYELELNGKKVGDEYLAPFCNDYHEWIQVQTYDITQNLKLGSNAVGALLGNGWYKGRFGFVGDMDELMGDHFALLAEIEILYEDGSRDLIVTDDSWSALPSPVQSSSIYDGEVFDARAEIAGRGTVDADLESAESARIYDHSFDLLEDRLSPPVVIKESRKPVAVIKTAAGEDVLDFGQVMTGWVRFDCDLPAGGKIDLQFGELLQHGNFYRDNLRSAKAEYGYVSDGRPASVRPHFTFYGFRFVKVSGLDEVNPADFTADVIYSDLEQTGVIETSNEKVNQLFSNTLWGQKGNFLDVPTDCPQRDERMGWTGDAQVFAATACFNLYSPAFFKKYLYDMKLEQRSRNGAVPHVVPDFIALANRKIGNEDTSDYASAAWADAACVIPWTLYLFYGDKTLLADQYENMQSWVDYVHSIDEKHCEGSRLWTHGFHFADWLALDNPENMKGEGHVSSFGGTDPYYVASAYYYYSTSLLTKAAGALGKTEDAEKYGKLAEEIQFAIRSRYFEADGRCKIQTQTAQVLALWFGLADRAAREVVVSDLKRLIDEAGGHLTTGFVGTAYLCLTLSDVGLHETAVSLLLNEEYPGWLYEVNMGATTVWERWNSVLEDGLVSDTGMNSMNHYAYGAIAEWMYRSLCGLNPLEEKPGFRHASIKPRPDRRLQHAKAAFKSPYGLYESGWRYEGDRIVYEVTIPYGAEARFEADISGDFTLNGKTVRHASGSPELNLTAGNYVISSRS